MKCTPISLCVTVSTVILIYHGLGVVAPEIYAEKAFNIIVYPSIAAGIAMALVWLRGRKLP